MKAPSHTLPKDIPPRLDLHVAPTGRPSRHYHQLVLLLNELGVALDAGNVDRTWIRSWEQSVLDLIEDGEIDLLMRPPDAPEFSLADLPQQRWLNLRHLLMRRKGLAA